MNTPSTGHSLTTRLVLQIESLQDGFRKLSRPMTLKDLAAQCVRITSNAFPGKTIDLLFSSGHAVSWQRLSGESPSTIQELLKVPEGDATSVFSRHYQSTCMSMVQRLVDKSLVGIVIGHKRTKKKFTDGDRVSLQLCLHLFDNAYQALLHRRNEKELVFTLNHRVLQLNSLVDTGIEVSKLGQEHSLQHLALERAASLTNASKGVLSTTA